VPYLPRPVISSGIKLLGIANTQLTECSTGQRITAAAAGTLIYLLLQQQLLLLLLLGAAAARSCCLPQWRTQPMDQPSGEAQAAAGQR